jgi:dipeptidyl aminopeptidase/acylaminoacyl peptidase
LLPGVRALFLSVGLLWGSMSCGAAEAARPLTVDDILKLSDVGSAIARPGTDDFVWEQSPPYDSLGDYGQGGAATWFHADYHIMTAGDSGGPPRTLFQPAPHTTYRLVSFSSDGRFLTLLAIHDGAMHVAAYDYAAHTVREYSMSPRLSIEELSLPGVVWLDSHRIAVATDEGGLGSFWYAFRRARGNYLTASWDKSWAGREASVDEFDSHAASESKPLAGALAIVDLASGQVDRVETGRLSTLRVSPKGQWLAAVRQSSLPQVAVDKDQSVDWVYARSHLTLFSTRSPTPRSLAGSLDVLPDSIVWDPAGERFAFYAWALGAGLLQGHFWICDAATGRLEMLAHDGLALASQRPRGGGEWPEHAAWLDGSIAVYARATPGRPGTLTYEDLGTPSVVDPRVALSSVKPHWFLLRKSTAPIDLTRGLRSVAALPLLADGARLIVAADGAAWSLATANPPVRLPQSFPEEIDIHANQHVRFASSVDSGFAPLMGAPGRFAYVAGKAAAPRLEAFSTPGNSTVLAVSGARSVLALSGAGKGSRLEILRADGAARPFPELNPHLDDVAETRWTPFRYAAPSGSTRPQLEGCLLLPPDYQDGEKRPMIVDVYPDRPGQCGPDSRRRTAMAASVSYLDEHLLAARGFVVFMPDTGGGIARSSEGPQANLAAVVDRGIDAVVAAGYADPSRLGLIGASQGGFVTLWLSTQSSRYRAVVSLNGWSDPAYEFMGMSPDEEFDPLELPPLGAYDRYLAPAGTSFHMDGPPWAIPETYLRNSPLWHAKAISAPLLLIHCDMDVFDDGAYKMMLTTLYQQKKDAKLLIYRGEGHALSSPANIRHLWRSVDDWFDRYLDIRRNEQGRIVLPP